MNVTTSRCTTEMTDASVRTEVPSFPTLFALEWLFIRKKVWFGVKGHGASRCIVGLSSLSTCAHSERLVQTAILTYLRYGRYGNVFVLSLPACWHFCILGAVMPCSLHAQSTTGNLITWLCITWSLVVLVHVQGSKFVFSWGSNFSSRVCNWSNKGLS